MVFFCGLTTLTSGQPILSGLMSWYPFSGNARDGSGHGNHGELFGVIPTADRFGNANAAYYFNGKSYITAPAINFKNETYTYSLWVRSSRNPAKGMGGTAIFIGDDTRRGQAFSVVNTKGAFGHTGWSAVTFPLGCRDGSIIATGELPEINRWYHVVIVRAHKFHSLYVDGKLMSVNKFKARQPYYGDPTQCIFGMRINFTETFTGSIDDIAIFNRALSEEEVIMLFNQRAISTKAGLQ